MNFAGMRALVTGGASGIGAAVAAAFFDRGAAVVVADLDPDPTQRGVIPVVCDVSDDVSVRSAVDAAADELGGLDIVVNNAGTGAVGTVETNPDDEWHRVYDVNVLGMVRVSRAALPHLRRSEHASIVNVCSVAALVGLPERALYSATKGAVLSLTMCMAADHLAEGVRVNCVSPGTVDTPWVGRLLSQALDPVRERAALEQRQPHGRLVLPEEVAIAVLALAGPFAGSTTGTNVTVDGGLTSLRPSLAAQ